jgi:hypothetical protein
MVAEAVGPPRLLHVHSESLRIFAERRAATMPPRYASITPCLRRGESQRAGELSLQPTQCPHPRRCVRLARARASRGVVGPTRPRRVRLT